jgi:hypothetical protein
MKAQEVLVPTLGSDGRVAVEETGIAAGWREDRATERNGFPIGGDGGIGSLCTSADRAFVSYGAKLFRIETPRPIIFRERSIPVRNSRCNYAVFNRPFGQR